MLTELIEWSMFLGMTPMMLHILRLAFAPCRRAIG